jgi:predicted flap endonuclease-1-like 5' DNA nuclease
MPDLSPASSLVAVLCLVAGLALGWWFRSSRSKAEKQAINAGWLGQMEATRKEHGRLAEQNKSLMEQVNQLQASNRDGGNRTRELSSALKEALAHRDDLQREIKVIRSNLENVVGEKHRLNNDLSQHRAGEASAQAALAEKDARIDKLRTELRNWQDRLPPLIERFRERNEEANRLEAALGAAEDRIHGLEDMLGSDQTLVEPMRATDLLESYDASNERIDAADDMADTEAAADEPADDRDIQAATAEDDAPAANGVEYAGGLRDNLRDIKGIGPAIEKTLNELGIFRYAQVAAMTRYDIERIANRLKGFQSRIEREDWIGQARALAENPAREADPVDLQAP